MGCYHLRPGFAQCWCSYHYIRHWTWLGIDKDTFARTQGDSTYKWYYDVEHVGFKYHGNSIMAAIASGVFTSAHHKLARTRG